MRIFLDSIIFDIQRAGGISKIWAKYISELSRLNCNFMSLESDKSKINIFRQELQEVKYEIHMASRINSSLRRYLPVGVRGFDIFHSSYYRLPIGLIKSVVTVHDFMYEKFDSGIARHAHVFQKTLAMRRADAIVCVSEHTKKDLLALYPWTNGKQIVVIHNGVDKEFYILPKRLEQLWVNGVCIKAYSYLLYVGARGYCKNFSRVIDLANAEFSRDNRLLLVCVGGGLFSPKESFAMESLIREGRIVQFEKLSSTDLNLLYNHARAFLFPSIYEGFGMPILEAARAGCPIIASNSSSIPEVLGNSDFYFDPWSASDAVAALTKLGDRDLVEGNIEKALEHSKTFSWEKVCNRNLDIYRRLLS